MNSLVHGWSDEELTQIKKGLSRVENLLVEHSNHSDAVLKDISENIKYLRESAKKSGRRDWLMMFVGTISSKLLEWGVTQITWQLLFTTLVESVKSILPGKQ
jgi:hypothetical protein